MKYGNNFCTVACAREHEKKQVFHVQQLEEHGFEQDPQTPNVYRKGGVAVTLERTMKCGVQQSIQQHGHALAANAARNTSQP